jgi:hypothetical protein
LAAPTISAVVVNCPDVMHTDEAAGHAEVDLGQAGDHAVAYVDGKVHTNRLENFWSLFKRGVNGTYVSVEPFHLFRYLDEQCFRFRKMTDGERFSDAVSGIAGKRVTFDQLPGNFTATRSSEMQKHADPALLADVDTILIDCAPRPDECFRLRPANLINDAIEIQHGKTENARRRIPMTPRVKAVMERRLERTRGSAWIFPAPTKSGHIEKSSLSKQHATALN